MEVSLDSGTLRRVDAGYAPNDRCLYAMRWPLRDQRAVDEDSRGTAATSFSKL